MCRKVFRGGWHRKNDIYFSQETLNLGFTLNYVQADSSGTEILYNGKAVPIVYGSLDEIISHADEIKGSDGEKIRNNYESALLCKKMATILREFDIALSIEDTYKNISLPSKVNISVLSLH